VEPNREQPELPGPSLWPVGFAIGIACLLIGLVVSWIVALVGTGLAIIFAALWVRELAGTRGVRAPDAGAPPEAVAGEPAELEPAERFPRSVFLEASTLGLGAVIGGIVIVPVLGFTVAPMFEDTGHPDIDLGPLENFEEGQFVVATFLENADKGYVTRRSAFVRYNGLLQGLPSFTILSNRCVHLGCPVQPNGPLFEDEKKMSGTVALIPTLPAGGFGCPCHGGQYDSEGNRTAGPPVRALDRFAYKIVNGRLVLGSTFSVGEVEGTGKDAIIIKYGLRGPGQHTNNIEKWLYPLQPPS
jgi:Rieske Fe-S protein